MLDSAFQHFAFEKKKKTDKSNKIIYTFLIIIAKCNDIPDLNLSQGSRKYNNKSTEREKYEMIIGPRVGSPVPSPSPERKEKVFVT